MGLDLFPLRRMQFEGLVEVVGMAVVGFLALESRGGHEFLDSEAHHHQSLLIGRRSNIYYLSYTLEEIYGVSFEKRYSGDEEVIFSLAISSKCNHLSYKKSRERAY